MSMTLRAVLLLQGEFEVCFPSPPFLTVSSAQSFGLGSGVALRRRTLLEDAALS
jgi:hypothetical protein